MYSESKTVGNGYFPVLRVCVFASFVALALASFLHLSAWLGMLGGGVPLIYYHRVYLTPRAKTGLPQAAIDSVYYFGFLVTVAALAVSAVSIALNDGKAPLNEIAFHFGLGLLATAYAVWARLHLTSLSSGVDSVSAEDVLERYAKRSTELVSNVELAAESFVTLAQRLTQRTEEASKLTQETTQKAMLDVARMFDQELRGTLSSAREGLSEVRGLMQEAAFVTEREELARSLKLTLDTVATLNSALASLRDTTSENAGATKSLLSTTSELEKSLSTFQGSLASVIAGDGPLVNASSAIVEVQRTICDAGTTLVTTVDEMKEMVGTVSGIGQTFKNVRTLNQKASEQLDGLIVSTGRLDEASLQLAQASQASGQLAHNIQHATQALPALSDAVTAIGRQLETMAATFATVQADIKTLPTPALELTRLGSEVSSALTQTAQALRGANSEAAALLHHTAEQVAAVKQARTVIVDISNLDGSTKAFQEALKTLTGNLQAMQTELTTTTSSLRHSFKSATDTLELDVKRSVEMSKLFGERMVGLANVIIEKTKEGRQP
ncbi:MAG: hypothetical protein CFE46_00790 [Burkholderiales bacterium PBB6]|nr:MAG: hypothetical protein CFE46_00790 [Burkholderiales bacterium PBB6]